MRTTWLMIGAMLMVACQASAPDSATNAATGTTKPLIVSTSSTQEVVQRHLKTFRASDLDGVLADYADDAVMFTPNGPIKGKEALRAAFTQFIAEWGQPGTTFNLQREHYDGERGYIVWTAQTGANVYEFGVDGFVVRDGKITSQFFGAKTMAKK